MRSTVTRRLPAAIRTAALAGVIAITLGACSGSATPAPTATPGSSPTAVPGELALDRAPDGIACDAIGVDYTSVTFHIDPTADPQIWAVADTGASLRVRWVSTFAAGTAAEPSVVDGSGAVVLEDGDTLELPDGGWPDLHGHMVCPGPSSLTVLDEAPPG